ncbi:hypothetical protein BSK53_19415 [Paenibacillus odorifer]|nr:hypothetical protein BSK53_19415 [Paenibacillus odorifer]
MAEDLSPNNTILLKLLQNGSKVPSEFENISAKIKKFEELFSCNIDQLTLSNYMRLTSQRNKITHFNESNKSLLYATSTLRNIAVSAPSKVEALLSELYNHSGFTRCASPFYKQRKARY